MYFTSDIDLPLSYMDSKYEVLSYFFNTVVFRETNGNKIFSSYRDNSYSVSKGDYQWFMLALERLAIWLHVSEDLSSNSQALEMLIRKMLPPRVGYNYKELEIQNVQGTPYNDSYSTLVEWPDLKNPMLKFLFQDKEFIDHNGITHPNNLTSHTFFDIIQEQCEQINCLLPANTTSHEIGTVRITYNDSNFSNRNTSILADEGESLFSNSAYWLFSLLAFPLLFILLCLCIKIGRHKKRKNERVHSQKKFDIENLPLMKSSTDISVPKNFDEFKKRHRDYLSNLLKSLSNFLGHLEIAKSEGFERLYKKPLDTAIATINESLYSDCVDALKSLKETVSTKAKDGDHFKNAPNTYNFLNLVVDNAIKNCSLLQLEPQGLQEGQELNPYLDIQYLYRIARQVSTLQSNIFQYLLHSNTHIEESITKISQAWIYSFGPELASHGYGYYLYLDPTKVNEIIGISKNYQDVSKDLRAGLMVLLNIGINTSKVILDLLIPSKSKDDRLTLTELAKAFSCLDQLKSIILERNGREEGREEGRKEASAANVSSMPSYQR